MKKLFRTFILFAIIGCIACAFSFSGCTKSCSEVMDPDDTVEDGGNQEEDGNPDEDQPDDSDGKSAYQGEYSYTQYGTEYGIKVEVEVEENVIRNVKVLDSDYTEASSEDMWDDRPLWDNGLNALLASYEGKTVDEILAITVACSEDGAPENGQTYDGLVITGATIGSGRLVLAVQDALKNLSQDNNS